MNKITIGIPRALLYYKYKTLWISFFESLGLNILLSPETNQEIIENGYKILDNNYCDSLRIYMGHINYLIDKCDYILIPKINSIKKEEKLCNNYLFLYDLVNNLFNTNLLTYTIDARNNELYAFIKIGKELGFSYYKIISAYNDAKQKEKMLMIRKINRQKSVLTNNKLKILIVGNPYNLYDEKIGKKLINILENNNISILFSDNVEKKYLNNICDHNYFIFNKENINSINYYKDIIDGIIILSVNNCYIDNLSYEIIKRKIDLPIIYLNNTENIDIKINELINKIKERNKKNEK